MRADKLQQLFEGARTCRRPKHVGMTGITKPLGKRFYPTFRFTGKDKNDVDALLRVKGAGNRVRKRKVGHSKRSGMARGSKVDSLVQKLVEGTKCSKRVLCSPPGRDAQVVLHALKERGLTPVACQVPAWHPEWPLWTTIDIVCIDKRGCVVLVEQKSGYESWYLKSSGQMLGCMADTPNSPMWQHQLQIMVAKELFRSTYPETAPKLITCVARLTSAGVHFYELEDRVATRSGVIIRELIHQGGAKERPAGAVPRRPAPRAGSA